MKTRKFLASSALALSMALTPAAAMLNALPVSAERVTVNVSGFDNDNAHTFIAYQIFEGSQQKNSTILGNIGWGKDVNGAALLEKLNAQNAPIPSLSGAENAAELAEKLEKAENPTTTALAFAKIVAECLKSDSGTPIDLVEGTDLDAGYYLIKDTTTPAPERDVVGLSILKLTGNEDGIEITPKNNHPAVDKQVKDEGAEGDVWGETADHDLNKKIDFKLTTTGLTKSGIANYDKYYLEFDDVLSSGLTYDGELSVKLGGNTLMAGENADYTVSLPSAGNGNQLTITIGDLKSVTGYDAAADDGINVTVEYKAHLNDGANINEVSGSIDNNNYVELKYSNDPNWNGTGTSPTGTSEKDYVYVASFKLKNTKKALSENGKALKDAGFELRKGDQVAVFNQAHKFQRWEDVNYTVQEGEYREISSDGNGDFSMYGLDAGTYTLVETTTPAGYNTAAPTTFTVSAKHYDVKDTDDTQSKPVVGEYESYVEISMVDSKPSNTHTVINSQNGTLPETGGMGTTMFYIAGSALVAGAAVIFVTNKRTRRN